MKLRRRVGLALMGAGLVVLSCSADRGSVPVEARADASVSPASATTLVESRAAATRIAELRTRFRLPMRGPDDDRLGLARAAPTKHAAPTTRPALGAPVATRFEAAAGPDAATHVRGVLPTDALDGVPRAARVSLPVRANGEVKLEDETSHLSVRFALEHVRDARIEVAGGMAVYRGALDGADVVQRVHAEGTEDFVVFETRPAHEELSYSVDVSHVPGLRLVSNTLEFLDETGTPLLRVAPPYVVDANGERHEAKLAVSGCAYDTSPAGPWGRKVTMPGAERCSVLVAWAGDITYPAMVDPAWGATGSLATARRLHSASVLPSSIVLVAGGYNGAYLASAELFDPAGNAGAGTFAATGSLATPREYHIASVLASGKVLIAGGETNGGASLSSAELYDPAGNAGAGTFAATGSMAAARVGHAASVLPSGKVLVAGGPSASAELFDPAGNAGAGTFATTGSMAGPRRFHTASMLLSGKVLVAGGQNGVSLLTAELYDPAGNAGAGTFATTGSMAAPRREHTASVLASGKVLVAGGNGAGAGAELYDPAGNAGAGTFAATGSMAIARNDHTAVVFPSGKVLVAGGINGAVSVAGAELFDPAGNAGAGTFSAAGSMAAARGYHTVSVLPSGAVLVAGGQGVGNAYLASAELFGLVDGGGTCTVAGECLSGVCEDGVCCSGSCSGACKTCTAGTGACVNVTGSDDPDTCTGANTCDAVGACKKKNGEVCPGGAATCASGNCVDGYCCNVPCDGGCDRCNATPGTCTNATLGDPGQSPSCAAYVCDGFSAACPSSCSTDTGCAKGFYCAPDGSCRARKAQASTCNLTSDCKVAGCGVCASGSCLDGVCCESACAVQPPSSCGNVGTCDASGACHKYPMGTACGAAASCTGGVAPAPLPTETRATACDGAGTCKTPVVVPCGEGYACGPTACSTTCIKTADCVVGYACSPATSQCVRAGVSATCDGDHTATGGDGTKQDCAPYKCDSNGTCRAACTSVNDCVAPTICDPTGKCVAPPADAGSGGGCSMVSARAGDARLQLAWFAAAAGLALVRRRRRSEEKAASQ